MLKSTVETAVAIKAIKPVELECVIIDSTIEGGRHPVDSRLLEIARHKVVSAARSAGISLKLTRAREGKELRRKAGADTSGTSRSGFLGDDARLGRAGQGRLPRGSDHHV